MGYADLLSGSSIAGMLAQAIAEMSTQTEDTPHWEEGRQIDMDAFDRLPRQVRDHINEHGSFYPIEDVLWEHQNDHRGDWELTLVWLLECEDLERELATVH